MPDFEPIAVSPHKGFLHVQIPKTIRLPHDAYGNTEAAFHLVIRAMPNTVPFQDHALGDAVWAIVEQQNSRTAVHLHAACLMPDHLHIVISPGSQSLITWANSFKSFTTRISWNFQPNSTLWQPSYYDRRLRDEAEFESALSYVVRNPGEAGLVTEEDAWAWSQTWPS